MYELALISNDVCFCREWPKNKVETLFIPKDNVRFHCFQEMTVPSGKLT